MTCNESLSCSLNLSVFLCHTEVAKSMQRTFTQQTLLKGKTQFLLPPKPTVKICNYSLNPPPNSRTDAALKVVNRYQLSDAICTRHFCQNCKHTIQAIYIAFQLLLARVHRCQRPLDVRGALSSRNLAENLDSIEIVAPHYVVQRREHTSLLLPSLTQ